MPEACSTHPDRAALYRCDACECRLCDDCVEAGHKLLFCRHCRERALPLAGTPAPQERARRRAAARPYSLADALRYPLRGSGKLMFVVTVVTMAVAGGVARFGMGLRALALVGAVWALLVGLQFKIVRDTAKGDDEVPDWPEYLDWGERIPDLFAYAVVALLQVGAVALYALAARQRWLVGEAGFGFWAGCAALLWLGSALAGMAFGAAGVHGAGEVVRVDRHVRGFFAAGADAVQTVNVTFGIGALVLVTRALLHRVPWVGELVSGVLGAYWTFVSAHLIGVLFRRRGPELDAIYEATQ